MHRTLIIQNVTHLDALNVTCISNMFSTLYQQNVEMFVTSNCEKFYRVKEFTHEHYALWKV